MALPILNIFHSVVHSVTALALTNDVHPQRGKACISVLELYGAILEVAAVQSVFRAGGKKKKKIEDL